MNDRLQWALVRRRRLARTLDGFSASLLSYATADCRFEGRNRLSGSAALQASNLGRGSYVNAARLNNVRVGRFCSIGFEALVGLGEHPVDRFATHPAFYSPNNPVGLRWTSTPLFQEMQPVSLGSDVWVGARATILSGVSIGDGAIVAAGSVVTKDVPSFAIVAGVPARLIRLRFPPELCEALSALKWWDCPLEQLRHCVSQIEQPMDHAVLGELKERLGASRDAASW
ncbi:CatB-related O-acetyltransferase [Pelomonas sp. Root1217]|uniref:CatB-related O-acetyltransferase n=1 Tax=Pelomonas sp. Root1217 TaxID=1736430 RepID=UPI0009EA003C|nr:CatB-related O-acetyltransferase [Pelomonas sp. Root1217]